MVCAKKFYQSDTVDIIEKETVAFEIAIFSTGLLLNALASFVKSSEERNTEYRSVIR